jgi:hypothetical protein
MGNNKNDEYILPALRVKKLTFYSDRQYLLASNY